MFEQRGFCVNLNTFKIVAVEFLDGVRFVVRDAHSMIYHKISKLRPIDQHDSRVSLFRSLARSRRETTGHDGTSTGTLVHPLRNK